MLNNIARASREAQPCNLCQRWFFQLTSIFSVNNKITPLCTSGAHLALNLGIVNMGSFQLAHVSNPLTKKNLVSDQASKGLTWNFFSGHLPSSSPKGSSQLGTITFPSREHPRIWELAGAYVVVQFYLWYMYNLFLNHYNIFWTSTNFLNQYKIFWTGTKYFESVQFFLNQYKIFWTGTKCFNLGQFVSTWVNLFQPRSICFIPRSICFILDNLFQPRPICFNLGSLFLQPRSICSKPC